MEQLQEEETNTKGNSQIQNGSGQKDDLNKEKVIYLGVFFMVILTSLNSYFTYSSIVYNQMDYSSLGMLSVATFFLFSAIGTIYSPWFSRTFFKTYQKKFLVASIPHCFQFLSGIFASTCYESPELECSEFMLYIIVLLSSAICGLGNALVWVLQGAYVTDCTSLKNKGDYFGLFLQISQICNISGPLLSSFLFKNFGTSGYFRIMFFLLVASNSLALLIKEPVPVQKQEVEAPRDSEYDKNNNKYFENYKDLNEKLIHRNSSLTPSPEKQKVDLNRLKNFLVEKYQIKHYFAVFFLNGFYLGYYWSQMGFLSASKLVDVSIQEKNQQIGLVFLFMGLIQIVLGRKIGASFDALDEKIIFYKRVIFISFLSITLVIIFYFLDFFYPFYLISLVFGLGEILIKSFIGSVLSLKFSENTYEAFAVYRLISNIASGAAMVLSSMFTPTAPLVMMISLFLNSYICFRQLPQIQRHLTDQNMFASTHSNN